MEDVVTIPQTMVITGLGTKTITTMDVRGFTNARYPKFGTINGYAFNWCRSLLSVDIDCSGNIPF